MNGELNTPVGLAELGRPEHLLVWTLRTIAVGRQDCLVVSQTFDRLCGQMGQHTLHCYFALVHYIGVSARRRLRVHVPGCPCVSADETALTGVVAAAQASLRDGDETLVRLRLASLVRGEVSEGAVFAAQAVGRGLAEAGHVLPVQVGEPPARGAGLRAVN